MVTTTNYSLKKPEEMEKVDLNLLNENIDDIDQILKNIEDNIQNAIETINNHIQDTENPHSITKTQIGLDNVENKSSSDILKGITRDNIVNSLGYVPCRTEEVDTKITESESRIQEAINETLTEKLNGITIAQDTEGNWGYIPPGTNLVIPFNSSDGGLSSTAFQIKTSTDFVKITPEVQEGVNNVL